MGAAFFFAGAFLVVVFFAAVAFAGAFFAVALAAALPPLDASARRTFWTWAEVAFFEPRSVAEWTVLPALSESLQTPLRKKMLTTLPTKPSCLPVVIRRQVPLVLATASGAVRLSIFLTALAGFLAFFASRVARVAAALAAFSLAAGDLRVLAGRFVVCWITQRSPIISWTVVNPAL